MLRVMQLLYYFLNVSVPLYFCSVWRGKYALGRWRWIWAPLCSLVVNWRSKCTKIHPCMDPRLLWVCVKHLSFFFSSSFFPSCPLFPSREALRVAYEDEPLIHHRNLWVVVVVVVVGVGGVGTMLKGTPVLLWCCRCTGFFCPNWRLKQKPFPS